MESFDTIGELLRLNRPGMTLPRDLYVGEEAFRFDTEVMLKSVWLYAGTVAHAKKPGDWFIFELGNNQVIIVRGRDGEIRAFYNSCRHRGSRICETESGSAARLQCPYHFWSYGLDGKLLAARNMPEGFSKAEHGLVPVAIENAGGLLFVCLSDNPPPFGQAKADMAEQIGLYDMSKLKVAVQDSLIEPANWKLVMENNRECYHCDQNHPELLQSLSTYGFGKGLPEDGDNDAGGAAPALDRPGDLSRPDRVSRGKRSARLSPRGAPAARQWRGVADGRWQGGVPHSDLEAWPGRNHQPVDLDPAQ